MESEIVYVKCPLCGKPFNSHENFQWLPDSDGHPTVESLRCPYCMAGTEPIFKCDWCSMQLSGKCDKEENCGCSVSFHYDDFKECDKDGNIIN